jgi:hypothetical protein
MPSYLVESYVPRARADELRDAAEHARMAAAALAAEGRVVRYLRSTFLPLDEVCLYLLEAESAAVAGEAMERAGISFERVVEALPVSLHAAAGSIHTREEQT